MNLPPDWAEFLRSAGIEAVHWSEVGDGRAEDAAIMAWARANNHVVLTHDLDFGTLLALTRATGPSVIQLRHQDVISPELRSVLAATLKDKVEILAKGALVTVDPVRARVRILPILS